MNIIIKHKGSAQQTVVLADGLDIADSLSGLNVSIGVKQVATIQLDLADFGELYLDLDNPKVTLSKETIKLLHKLGWIRGIEVEL